MAKKGVYKISGNVKPLVGKKEYYTVDEWYSSTPLADRNPAKVIWELFIKTDNGFRTTNIKKKGINHFTFGKNAYQNVYKIEGYLHEPEGNSPMSLIVQPQKGGDKKAAEKKDISNVVLTYEDDTKINKPLSYRDRLKATAICEGLEGESIVFKLWEDDETGNGHHYKNQFITKSSPIQVNKFGKAKWSFSLSPTFITLANKRENDKSKHEYYVTAEFNGKILEDSQNVNVKNPENRTEKSKTAPQKPSFPKPLPKKETAKFPTRPTSPKKQNDPKSKILNAEFVDRNGKKINSVKIGTTVSIRIISKNMKDKAVTVKIWEDDTFNDDLLFEKKIRITNDEAYINNITLSKSMYEKGHAWETEGSTQEYYIEVEHLTVSTESSRIEVELHEEPKKIENGKSPAVAKKTEIAKVNTSCNCKQYDLIWGNKVNCEFRKKVVQICTELWGESQKMEMANGLMAVMNVETRGSFKAQQLEGWKSVKVPKEMTIKDFWKDGKRESSRAIGLIQFTQDALQKNLREYVSNPKLSKPERFDELNKLKLQYAQMGEIKQLDKVKKYFESQKNNIKSPEDIYLAVFAPKGVGKNNDYILYQRGTDEYDANASVDIKSKGKDKNDGKIQRSEILERFHSSMNEGKASKATSFTCGINNDNTGNLNAKDIVTYRIYANGTIEKHIPKNIKVGYEQKYKYVYHDASNTEFEICITTWHTTTKKLPSRSKLYSKPTHSRVLSDEIVVEGQTRRRVKYVNGDIAEYGSNQGDTFWRLYSSTSEKIELVEMPEKVSYVRYSFSGTKRKYTGPNYYAGFIGTLAKTGLSISTTGSCFREGSCFPSQFHVNGESVDTIYFRNLETDQKFIDAMMFFHFRERKAGNDAYFRRLRNVSDGGNLHDSHLHCGNFDVLKVKIIKE